MLRGGDSMSAVERHMLDSPVVPENYRSYYRSSSAGDAFADSALMSVPDSSSDPEYEGIANTDNVQAAMAEYGLSAADVQAENFKFNAEQAALQRQAAMDLLKYQYDRQEEFSKNAVYYRMQDLKNSGINPVLAYQAGGASVPSAASPGLAAAASSYQGGDTASDMIKGFAEYGSYYAKMIQAVSGAVNGLIKAIGSFFG